jgi:hypothetical protein
MRFLVPALWAITISSGTGARFVAAALAASSTATGTSLLANPGAQISCVHSTSCELVESNIGIDLIRLYQLISFGDRLTRFELFDALLDGNELVL